MKRIHNEDISAPQTMHQNICVACESIGDNISQQPGDIQWYKK
jgi:hypothetical protein